MKIAYDRAADALYIRLLEGVDQCRVVRLSEDIAVDFGMEDIPVGIEMLHASRLFDTPDSHSVELQHVTPKAS